MRFTLLQLTTDLVTLSGVVLVTLWEIFGAPASTFSAHPSTGLVPSAAGAVADASVNASLQELSQLSVSHSHLLRSNVSSGMHGKHVNSYWGSSGTTAVSAAAGGLAHFQGLPAALRPSCHFFNASGGGSGAAQLCWYLQFLLVLGQSFIDQGKHLY